MNIFKDSKSKKTYYRLKILFILGGVLQGLSIVLTIPLLKAIFLGSSDIILTYLICIGLLALLCFVIHFIGINIGNHMSVWEVCDSKTREIGSSIINLPLGYFDLTSKGKISKAISTDINTISHYPPIILPEILTVVFSCIVIAISLVFISLKYALILFVMVILMVYFWKKNTEALRLVEDENEISNQNMESRIIEFAQLQPVLRASGCLEYGWDRLDKALTDDKHATLKTLNKKRSSYLGYMLTVNVGVILIFIISALELKNGVIEIYTFIGIAIAMLRLANPLAGLLGYISEIFNIKSSVRRIDTIINSENLPETTKNVSINVQSKNGYDIEFKNVDFSYIKGTKVLENINLSIPAGSITALVGNSGSGKSTMNKLIARFCDVDNGEILINGHNIKDIKTKELMKLISMVFQEVYLFNTTIKENVLIANPYATEEEVLLAAKKSRLDEVIERLPEGWDTNVGEGGSLLSGGEKQRVSIARAFLKNSPILLLDEITSALDGLNEAVITKSLEELSKDKTVVVIAHRLSSIKNANKIVVLDHGEIIGCNTHENLLKTSEKYKNLWASLIDSEDWRIK